MFLGKRNEEKRKAATTQVGDRFAITYGQLSTPLYRFEEHPYHDAFAEENFHNLNMDEVANLWTVIEYIGENQFMDLVTGEIYIDQVNIDHVRDTVTREYEEEAQEMYCDLVEHPLGLRKITRLTTEIKQKILEETLPRQDEIILIMERKKKTAQKLVLDFYKRKNRAKMHQLYNEATIENKRIDEVIRKQKELEERRRQEEEARLAAIRLSQEIDPKFDIVFPINRAKCLTKRKED